MLLWWEARFERITLEDRNLPEIAARRVLRPRNEEAGQQIDHAYADTGKVRREVFETPLTPRADSAMFRRVYSFLQSGARRDPGRRLVAPAAGEDRAAGDAPDPGRPARDVRPGRDRSGRRSLRRNCRAGRAVHRKHAPPLRERPQPLPPEAPPAHREPAGIAKAEAETRPKNDKAARALRAEDPLAKTLLLSALAPEVEVLKNLTATRLAALNYGTPIEGREGQKVLRRCRAWAAELGEVRVGDDPANPTITSSSRRSIPRASSPTPTRSTIPGIGAA